MVSTLSHIDTSFKLRSVTTAELIRDIASYDPSKPNNAQLADDMRICFAWYSSLKEGKKFKLTLKDVIALAKKVYAEIENRKRESKMKHEWNPKGMKPHSKELFNIIIKKSPLTMDAKDQGCGKAWEVLFAEGMAVQYFENEKHAHDFADEVNECSTSHGFAKDVIHVKYSFVHRHSKTKRCYPVNKKPVHYKCDSKENINEPTKLELSYKEECAHIWIDSVPQKARIWINGVDVGDLTPAKSAGYYLEPGTHKIELVKKNYLVWSKTLTLGTNEDWSKIVTLTPSVNFKINTTPEKARIWLDRIRLSDLTPSKKAGYFLDPGVHKVKLEKKGYANYEMELNLTSDYNETIALFSHLSNSKDRQEELFYKEDCAHIWIDSVPQKARIWINGVDVGDLTPAKKAGYYLEPGTHKIELVKKNYLTENIMLTLSAEEGWGTTIKLTPRVNLKTNSTPEKARIWLDRIRLSDLTPSKKAGYFLDPGIHKLKLGKKGYIDYETELAISQDYDVNIPLLSDKAKFISDCFNTSDEVICSKTTLWNYASDHTVSYFWWLMNLKQRKNVAKQIINNWLLLYYPYWGWENGSGKCTNILWDEPAPCGPNALLRCSRLGNPDAFGRVTCCLAPRPGIGHHLHFEDCPSGFQLPVCIVAAKGHFMAAIQVNKPVESFSSWIFFQYYDVNIQPGNWQMPHGCTLHLDSITKLLSCSTYTGSDVCSINIQ